MAITGNTFRTSGDKRSATYRTYIQLQLTTATTQSPTDLAHEVLSERADVAGEAEIHSADPAVRLLVSFSLERRPTDQELVTQDAERPDVHLFVVLVSLDHLRGQVVERATQGAASGGIGIQGQDSRL